MALLLLVSACALPPAEERLGRGFVLFPQEPAGAGARAEPWAERFIEPVSAPFLFESPVVQTSLQAVHLRHDFPRSSVFGGGGLDGYALQARVALTERLAFIAVKDGRVDFHPHTVPDAHGDLDIGGGLKYVVHEDPEAGTIVAVGLVYEGTNGDAEVFQGNGDGIWRPFVSAGWDLGRWNLLGAVGYANPVDDDDESTSFDYHLHVDYEATERFRPLLEINGITYTQDGATLPVSFEGVDYGNLGATSVEGNDVFTGALGFRYRLSDRASFGAAYESTIGGREDIFEDRVTLDLVTRF